MTSPQEPASDSPREKQSSGFDVTELLPGDATGAMDAAMLAALRAPVPQPGAHRAELEQLIDKFRQLPEQLPYPLSRAEVGQRLQYMGDYELLEPIGRGGMGVVYRARQLSLQREVAIKLLIGAQYASPELQERFRREAEAVAGLDHPHIIPVYEIGTHLDQHYFSMKLVPGLNLAQSLRDWTSAGDFSAAERRRRELAIAQLMETIADAVHHAHQHGVLHRDIKPSNILLDAQGEPHVTDFGLAKDLDSQANLTATGAVLGTPAYMSPEQAAGRRDISTAADVYGLGAILYELLSGQVPYKGGSSAEILRLVLDTDPKQPRSLNPHLDRDLETICLRCLRKEPRERYASAAELAEELRRFQRGEPILARPISVRERLMKWARRKPAAAALALVSMLGLVALIVGLVAGNQLIRKEQVKTQQALTEKSAALVDRTAALDREERGSYIKTIALAYRDVRENDIRHAYQLLQTCPVERREWEWHYLMRRCQGDYRELPSGGFLVQAIAYSPDGKYLATAAAESSGSRPQMLVRIWRTDTLEILHTLRPADFISQVNQVWRSRLVFTPDSNELLVTGFRADDLSTGYMTRWTVLTGQESPLPHGSFPGRQIMDLPLHPDGFVRALTTPIELGAEPQMQLELVDLKTGVVDRTIQQPANSVPTTGHYLDADTFLLQSHEVAKIDLKTGAQAWRHALDSACALAVNSGSQWGAYVSEMGDLTLVDLATGEKKYTRRVHRNAVEGVTFHPQEGVLATLGYDGVIRVANIHDGSEVRKMTGLRESPFVLTFDPTGEQIATDGLPDGRIALWRWKGEKPINNLGAIINLAVTSKLVAVAEQQGYVSVWNKDSWKLERKIPDNVRLPILNSLAIDPQGKCLATGDGHFREPDGPGQVKLWNLQTGELLHTFPPAPRFIKSLQFSPDGKSIGWTGGKQLVLYDLERKQEIFSVPLKNPHATFAFRPKSREIVMSDFDDGAELGLLYVVDSQTGQKLRELASPADSQTRVYYNSPRFSDDGRWLLVGAGNSRGASRVIRWDAEQGTVAQSYSGGFMEVGPPLMSPNGRRIFACFYDGSVAVWDTESGEEVLHMVDAEHQLYDLELLPDGMLIAGGFEGTLHRWDGRPVADPTR